MCISFIILSEIARFHDFRKKKLSSHLVRATEQKLIINPENTLHYPHDCCTELPHAQSPDYRIACVFTFSIFRQNEVVIQQLSQADSFTKQVTVNML